MCRIIWDRFPVEIDESYLGGEKPGKRGRGATGKALVMIAAECDGTRVGRIRLNKRIKDASGNSLEAAIQEVVKPGTNIRTDGWKGYNRLMHLGYIHEPMRLIPICIQVVIPECFYRGYGSQQNRIPD
jgi:transposase-like protein